MAPPRETPFSYSTLGYDPGITPQILDSAGKACQGQNASAYYELFY
jgi:hypothetical protein